MRFHKLLSVLLLAALPSYAGKPLPPANDLPVKDIFLARIVEDVISLTSGATVTLDASLGNVFTLTPLETCTINLTNRQAGRKLLVEILSNGQGAVVTFGTNFKSNGTVSSGVVSGKAFVVGFYDDGTNALEIGRSGPDGLGITLIAPSIFNVTNAALSHTMTLATQTANTGFMGPVSGGAAGPTFRALVPADYPTMVAATGGADGEKGAVPKPVAGEQAKCLSGAGTYVTCAGGGGGGVTTLNTLSGDVTLAAGTNVTITPSGQTLTVASQSIGTRWVFTDPNFTIPATYERVNYAMGLGTGLVQLKPARTFSVTHANAIASTTTMETWTSRNTSNLTSADSNTTLAGALHLVHNTSATDDQINATDTGANFYRAHDTGLGAQEIVSYVKIGTTQAGLVLAIEIQDASQTYWARIGIRSGTPTIESHFTTASTTTAGATAALTAQQINTDGVWMRVIRVGTDATVYYSTAVQATPPTTWTYLDGKGGVFKSGGSPHRTAIYFYRYNSSATVGVTGDVMYFDGNFLPSPFGNVGVDVGTGAAGYDDGSPVLTLVAGFDLGASGATVANANVQAALVEITNPRFFDAATWTWSVSRDASAPVACGGGTYAAAASVTVGGSGRYLSVCGKAASSGRIVPGSVDATALRIPFTP